MFFAKSIDLGDYTLVPASNYKRDTRTQALICVLNVFLTPFLLAAHSIRIYIYPCFYGLLQSLLWDPFITLCSKFTDSAFPPNESSLGRVDSGTQNVKWIRIQDLVVPNGKDKGQQVNRLFDGIEPSDICQGALGDCWLLAAFAALTEKPFLIQNAFVTRSFNPRGKYIIRLFDTGEKKFKNIEVDDYVPCDSRSGLPKYQKLNSNEMWPLLLEKAFAKFRGGYDKIEGGNPLDALQTLTGYVGEYNFVSKDKEITDKLFEKLQVCDNNLCLMAAGTVGRDNTLELGRDSVQGSIVGGHAYTIISVYTPMLTTGKVRLLKIRNPWGTFAWKGAWSKDSKEWTDYPGVALEVHHKPEDDGVFFMAWEDFIQYYRSIQILYPDRSINNMHITIHEDRKCVGFVSGCFCGLLRFYCLCLGFYNLWFEKSSIELQDELNNKNAGKGPSATTIVSRV